MNKRITSILMLLTFGLNAQVETVVSFEDLALTSDSFWLSPAENENTFMSNGVTFPSNTTDGYWSNGFAYSNKTDSVTSGYTNSYSAKPASGHNASANYAVVYSDGYINPLIENGNSSVVVSGFFIANNTFAYNSMRDGDPYAKKFGGISGNDPDFFSVTFNGFKYGQPSGEPVVFYLADFRSSDNSLDYIVGDWRWVDLTQLTYVDSISYTFETTDVGEFGRNTPLHFCIDDLEIHQDIIGLNDISSVAGIYPNPTQGILNITFTSEINEVSILDLSGRTLYSRKLNAMNANLDLSFLSNGIYTAEIMSGDKRQSSKFVIAH